MKNKLNAIKVHQWLDIWNQVKFEDNESRKKPDPFFYLFSIDANDLRILSDIHRRKAEGRRSTDTGVQRVHNKQRSEEISEFIKGGFPWSVLSNSKRESDQYKDLRMPGWLPTAIIANIKAPNTIRAGKKLIEEDSIKIEDKESEIVTINLPRNFRSNSWIPTSKPIEIIDGQHRLLSFFDTLSESDRYEIPVVAFYDLDTTWQAYLFYVINIKPKKINTSLAYDLYPILRVQDWLEKSPDGAIIYRETRAQELTEILWMHPSSPWFQRINMLGDNKNAPVSQAAFIRSLISSYIKSWEGRGTSIGGLFGAKIESLSNDILYWSRTQQAAFLILVWKKCEEAIIASKSEWAAKLRQQVIDESEEDATFYSKYSLLATDQGVRGILQISNDLCYVYAEELELMDWSYEYANDEIELEEVTLALENLEELPVKNFLERVFTVLSMFDWRTSSTPNLNDDERRKQMVFRGSGGYKELRKQLLHCLEISNDKEISDLSKKVLDILGYE